MSNEIAVRANATVADYQGTAVQRLGEWAQSASAAHEVASQLVQTSFVPEAFRGKAHEATAAILAGAEVGLSPMASLRSFDLIQGTAAPRALTLRAIVQSFGHEVVVDESTASRCVIRGRRKGSSEWQKVVWTLDRAKQLQLTGKHNWKNQPQAMLVARATSEVCRLIAADAILGIGYSSEEISDGAAGDVAVEVDQVEASAPTGTRRMSRKKAGETPAAPPEGWTETPNADDDPPVVEPDFGPAASPITDAQMKKIGVLMGKKSGLGLTDKADALDYVAQVIGREVESRNELSKAEASDVIEKLESDVRAKADEVDPWAASEQDAADDAATADGGAA